MAGIANKQGEPTDIDSLSSGDPMMSTTEENAAENCMDMLESNGELDDDIEIDVFRVEHVSKFVTHSKRSVEKMVDFRKEGK